MLYRWHKLWPQVHSRRYAQAGSAESETNWWFGGRRSSILAFVSVASRLGRRPKRLKETSNSSSIHSQARLDESIPCSSSSAYRPSNQGATDGLTELQVCQTQLMMMMMMMMMMIHCACGVTVCYVPCNWSIAGLNLPQAIEEHPWMNWSPIIL